MQCKDIPDEPVLRFLLYHKGKWCNWFEESERSVFNAMPGGIPGNLVHAKMKSLIRRGLVKGCICGCRGDFEITEKGEQWLAKIDEGQR